MNATFPDKLSKSKQIMGSLLMSSWFCNLLNTAFSMVKTPSGKVGYTFDPWPETKITRLKQLRLQAAARVWMLQQKESRAATKPKRSNK